MFSQSSRKIITTLAVVALSLASITAKGPIAAASEAVDASGEVVEVPLLRLPEIHQQLPYLSERDSPRPDWNAEFNNQLSASETSLINQCSCDEQLPCDCGACCEACGQSTGCGAACSCGGGCNSCLCTPQAPCVSCSRVSTLNPYFNVSVFGAVTVDMLFNTRRPISPGTPYFLAPGPVLGRDQATFDLHARQSTLGAVLTGPQLGGMQAGGQVLGVFYNDNVLADKYGLLPMQAYGELRSDAGRFAAGLQFDVFNPIVPTMLPFSAFSATGNTGNSFRGQVRLERFLTPSDDVQWTLQAALAEPISSTIDPTFRVSEDNGWPNVEARVALGLGPLQGSGAAAQRPLEFGVSGLVGQIRTTPLPPSPQVVADVWGAGADLRWRFSEAFGMAAEVYSGQTLGTYNGAILQTVGDSLDGIRSTGGWCELYMYLSPCLHTHWGYGIDNPLDRDVSINPAVLPRLRNETYFANLLWDVNAAVRIGFEFTWRETIYNALPDNEGAGFHTQFRWAF